MKRILFYSPFGSRTGSDMMLSYLIQYSNRELYYPIVFSVKKWELMNHLSREIPVYSSILERSRGKRGIEYLGRKLFKTSLYEEHILKIIKKHKPDLIYLNTIIVHDIIDVLKKTNIPFITHCHELNSSYQQVSAPDLDFILNNSRLMIGCSREVCAQLKTLGAENVALVPEAIDPTRFLKKKQSQSITREKWGIPENVEVWVMAGLRHYRKGYDYVPYLAKRLQQHDIWLMWIGKSYGTGYDRLIEKQIANDQLNNVLLIGELEEDYSDLLDLSSGLILTSREDPFPLVMLEAAFLGKPIVSFDSGGVKEFLTEGMGKVVEQFDIEKLCVALLDISAGRIKTDSELIRRRSKEFEITNVIETWHKVIQALQ
jgi:glycosyltransferase involved in cell wall biosynthesis